MISDLITILRKAGIKPTAEELADIFWLALQIDASKQPADAIPRPKEQSESDEKISQEQDSVTKVELPDLGNPVSHSHLTPLGSNVHISSQRKRKEREAKGPKTGALPIKSPAAPALADTLGIGRALRPLMQRTPSHIHSTLDEVRTAEYIAEQGIWIPVLKPASERWLELALVIDDSRSMVIWRQMIEHLQLVLERQGAFRDVRVWQLATSEDGNDVRILTEVGRTVNRQIGRSPKELLDPNGQRLILVVSDCVSRAWSQGTMSELLSVWGRIGPVALIQVLPQWLWSRSILGDAVEGVLRAPLPVLPNVQLDFIPSNYLVEKEDVKGRLPLPVVALERKALGQWTQALMSMENIWAPGYLLDIQAKAYGLANKQRGGESLPITPEQRIKRFRATASQTARMLVGLLAATPLINLHTIRLIQDAMLPHSEQGHVAEVLLGGLLEQLPMEEEAIEPEFDFFDGVRELLLNAMPTNISLEVLTHVSEYIESRFGQFLDFNALVENPSLVDRGVIDEGSKPFLRITAKILRRLGGEYTALALRLETSLDEQKMLIAAATDDKQMQKDEQTIVMRLIDKLDRSADRRKYDEDGELVSLDLSHSNLSELPAEIGQFPTLQELYLNDNQLSELPAEIEQLVALRRLGLSGNQLSTLPAEIGQLIALQDLDMSRNQLSELPPEIWKLTESQELYLDNNQLSTLSTQVGQLSHLRKLYLNNNQLTSLPAELGQLSHLQELSLSGNPLTHLPVEIGLLPSLNDLFVEDCPLLTPPPEIVVQGTSAILTFMRELYGQHIMRYEGKLIIVGEGGTGKTSLLRALHGKELDPTIPTTHGIELGMLLLPHPSDPSIELTMNTWDFGGQQIYHATHQFFLTKRSLYLVVWNARQGVDQARLPYWLDTIKALAPDSPILLVATHTDERVPSLNYSLYRDAYLQVSGAMNVSNKDGTGIEDLKRMIAQQATTLSLVGQPWPTNWIEVEKTLMAREEHHISANEYKSICATKGVEVKIAQGTLGSYLHDLGKILYFRDDYELMNLVVLKPSWVTRAIISVLENEGVREAHGILAHSYLPRIWAWDEQGKPYDEHLYPVFLRLMERFDLSYQIEPDVPGTPRSHSLVPQLLPYQPPPDLPAWPKQPEEGQTQLQMIYRFDFIPSGIMSWFIVRTHRYTIDKHWREGVLLAYEQQDARVELNPIRQELYLLVRGPQPHNFFTILKETLESILKRFVGLSITRMVPCICHWQTHAHEACRRTYLYEDLVRRMEAGKQTVECPDSFEEVPIAKMLYGIHTITAPQVYADIESSKQEILQSLQSLHSTQTASLSTDELILGQVQKTNQLTEWNLRNFTRSWNIQRRWLEAECPNTFILTLDSKTPFHPNKNLIDQKYRLFLLCQYPSGPHRISGDRGYELGKPHGWWLKVSPWLKHLVTFLKYSFPIAGLGMAGLDPKDFKALDNEIELLGKLHEELPEIVGTDASLDQEELSTDNEVVGSALRVLCQFLNEADPFKKWAGLEKVITPEGNILWLCQEHTPLYRTQPLLLDDEV
jgi:internalin A